jgi:ribosome modulation factor
MTEEKKDPRLEGRAARVMLASTGVCGSYDDCKYSEGSSEREEWMAGWNEMNDEYKKIPLWDIP